MPYNLKIAIEKLTPEQRYVIINYYFKNKTLSKISCEYLLIIGIILSITKTSVASSCLAFTNNSGPLFIVGTVGISLFGDSRIGLKYFPSQGTTLVWLKSSVATKKGKRVGTTEFAHRISPIDITFRNYHSESKELIKVANLGEILGDAIK